MQVVTHVGFVALLAKVSAAALCRMLEFRVRPGSFLYGRMSKPLETFKHIYQGFGGSRQSSHAYAERVGSAKLRVVRTGDVIALNLCLVNTIANSLLHTITNQTVNKDRV